MPFCLSILDKCPRQPEETSQQALQNTLALARLAEQAGYYRYWIAEHHNTSALASPSPEIVLAWLAAQTKTLRLGAGQRVIVGSGTNQERILLDLNAQLQQQHLPPATPIYLTDDATTTLFLQSGRADITFGPQAAAAWKAALNGRSKVVGYSPYKAWVVTTTLKGNGLVKALNQALNDAIASGHYQKILSRWGEAQEGVTSSQINPPGITYQ